MDHNAFMRQELGTYLPEDVINNLKPLELHLLFGELKTMLLRKDENLFYALFQREYQNFLNNYPDT